MRRGGTEEGKGRKLISVDTDEVMMATEDRLDG